MSKNRNRNMLKNLALITQLGITGIAPIILGIWIGQFLDKKIGKNGIFTVIFIFLGAGAGLLNIIKTAMPKDNKEEDGDDRYE